MTPISQELIRRREELGWTIADVSSKTRIRIRVLESIEDGNFDVLPPAYVRSYLKIYSQIVGLSEDEMLVLLNESIPSTSELQAGSSPDSYTSLKYDGRQLSSQPGSTPIKISQPIISTIVYGAFAVCIGVLVYYFFFRSEPSSTLSMRPGEMAGTTEITDDTAQASSKGGGMLSYFNDTFPADSIILEAQTTDTAWLTINIDGQRSQQITILPPQQLRWAAKDYFILSLGNAGAISLKRNGKQLQKFGSKGSVVRQIKITSNDVIASSEPYTTTEPTAQQTKNSSSVQNKNKQSSQITFQQRQNTQAQTNTKNSQQVLTTAKQPINPTNIQSVPKQAQTQQTVYGNSIKHTPDTHTTAVQQKPKPQTTKNNAQQKKLQEKKKLQQKHAKSSPALQRIIGNTSRETKKQRPEIIPVTPMPIKSEQPKYSPSPQHPIEKKNDD